MLPLDHCDLGVLYVSIEEGEKVAHFAFGLKRQWLTLKPAHPLVWLLKRMSRNCDYVEGSLLACVVPLAPNSGGVVNPIKDFHSPLMLRFCYYAL